MSNRPARTVAELEQDMRELGEPGKGARAMISRYPGECGWCGQALLPGDVIAWLPHDKAALCAGCAVDCDRKP